MNLYVICDKKAGIFKAPFVAQSKPECMRAITALVRDEKSLVAQFPDDFSVYSIGQMDPKTAILTTPPMPVFEFEVREVVEADKP